MPANRTIVVFGAYGHTGRFVVAELLKRGLTPILAGRDAAKLHASGAIYPGVGVRVAAADDPASLDRAAYGAAAIINCAGPFVDTAAPLIDAALRARIHYLDVTAEQASALATFERYGEAARDAGVVIAPAMAFYGGLGDLLASAAMGDWDRADEICIAVALDRWWPTQGTRLTGQRNTGRRLIFSGGALVPLPDPPPTRGWAFPEPFGAQEVVALPLAETITISRHLRATEIRAFINLAPLKDLHDPDTPTPTAADESGRSSQRFLMEAVARRGDDERRWQVRGRDIYAITAPIVVEAAERILDGRFKVAGVATAGQLFAAECFLHALSCEYLSVTAS